jgi:hypothetical protein
MESDARYFIFTCEFIYCNCNSRNPEDYSGSNDKIYLLWYILYRALDILIYGNYWYPFWRNRKWLCSEFSILLEWIRFKIIFKDCRFIYFSSTFIPLFLGSTISCSDDISSFELNEDYKINYLLVIDLETVFKLFIFPVSTTIILQFNEYVRCEIKR